MASVFKAQRILELDGIDGASIASLLAYDDQMLVGLSCGALRTYRINIASGAPAVEDRSNARAESARSTRAKFIREEAKFGKGAIQQLGLVKEANVLVSLSAGYVHLHDLQTYGLLQTLGQTQGASLFALTTDLVHNPSTSVPSLQTRLAVGMRQNAICWTWLDMQLTPEIVEFSVKEKIVSLIWASDSRLVASGSSGFNILTIVSQVASAAVGPTAETMPAEFRPRKATNERFADSSNGLGFNLGRKIPKPLATALSTERALLVRGTDIVRVESASVITRRPVPWTHPLDAIGYSHPYLLILQSSGQQALRIRDSEKLGLLQSIELPDATALYVPQRSTNLAHSGKGVLAASNHTIWSLESETYSTTLAELIDGGHLDDASNLLEQLHEDLIDQKTRRIREVKMLKATKLFYEHQFGASLELFTDAEAPPDRVISLYPECIRSHVLSRHDTASERHFAKVEANTHLEEQELRCALRSLHPFLAQARQRVQRFLDFDGSLKDVVALEPTARGAPAFVDLLPQTVHIRNPTATEWAAELLRVARTIDTSLFLADIRAMPALVGPLVRVNNFCNVDVVQSALSKAERYDDLIDFFHRKTLYRRALEVLAHLATHQSVGTAFEHRRALERLIRYLERLPRDATTLFWGYARAAMQNQPGLGIDVLFAHPEAARRLPPQQILELLSSTGNNELEIQYLEYVTLELGHQHADYHHHLIESYLRGMHNHRTGDIHWTKYKNRLEAFLLTSTAFDRDFVLQRLPTDDSTLFNSRATVLGALGRHNEALCLYIYRIGSCLQAEQYCSRIYFRAQVEADGGDADIPITGKRSTNETHPSVFDVLFSIYLNPPASETRRWPEAFGLLRRHGACLDLLKTLEVLPNDLKVANVQPYLAQCFRATTSSLHEVLISRGLEEERNFQVGSTLLLGPADAVVQQVAGLGRRVRVTHNDRCRVCERQLRTSAVVVHPNNEVVHYGCCGKEAKRK